MGPPGSVEAYSSGAKATRGMKSSSVATNTPTTIKPERLSRKRLNLSETVPLTTAP